ncbi:MAG: helix-turn-helix domain-containing protein [Rikenellaceae bacterium]|nr:helix-turn-helix domain-containing protein [Rikenellaceae bacterium]
MKLVVIREEEFVKMKEAITDLINEINKLIHGNARDKSWLDSQDVCLRLGICKRTLHYYKVKGILPYSMVGKKVFFKETDVEKLLDEVKPK